MTYLPFIWPISTGWKTALETISANSRPTIIEREREPAPPQSQGPGVVDPQLLLDLNSKWSRSQLDLQAKLDEMAQKVCVLSAYHHCCFAHFDLLMLICKIFVHILLVFVPRNKSPHSKRSLTRS